MKATRLRRRKRSILWKMQNLVRQAALLRLPIPLTRVRALSDEEAGADIGRGGHEMSTGWEDQGSGGEGRGVMKDGSGVRRNAAVRHQG